MTVGFHTLEHLALPSVSDVALADVLHRGRSELSSTVGQDLGLFAYPYARTREVLDVQRRSGEPHPSHGFKMRFINPVTGGHPMPTIAAFMQLLPSGFHGARYRATDATVYAAVEGTGVTMVGETRYEWGPRDVFVVPSWMPVSHQAQAEAVLFSMSDRAAQQALGLWREEGDGVRS